MLKMGNKSTKEMFQPKSFIIDECKKQGKIPTFEQIYEAMNEQFFLGSINQYSVIDEISQLNEFAETKIINLKQKDENKSSKISKTNSDNGKKKAYPEIYKKEVIESYDKRPASMKAVDWYHELPLCLVSDSKKYGRKPALSTIQSSWIK